MLILFFAEKHVKNKDLIDCESMVLYHIEECAILSRGCVSQLLRLAKTSVYCPEIILDPFILTVLLSLSSISVYEAQVLHVGFIVYVYIVFEHFLPLYV